MIVIKTLQEIKKLRESNRIVAEILEKFKSQLKIGIDTLKLNDTVNEVAKKRGAVPGFLNYDGFPYSLCVSINNEVVHGFPCDKCIVEEGDIIGLDVGILKDGYYGDAAITIIVGKVGFKEELLVQITEECLYKGIEQAIPGNRIGDISHAIQFHAHKYGFDVVRDYGGHGVGKQLHEDPHIDNYGEAGQGYLLKEGMVLAIEPMLVEGKPEVETLEDGWTVVTKDGSLSAHFEHTIAITEKDNKILSKL